jgi:hypothetical protein
VGGGVTVENPASVKSGTLSNHANSFEDDDEHEFEDDSRNAGEGTRTPKDCSTRS